MACVMRSTTIQSHPTEAPSRYIDFGITENNRSHLEELSSPELVVPTSDPSQQHISSSPAVVRSDNSVAPPRSQQACVAEIGAITESVPFGILEGLTEEQLEDANAEPRDASSSKLSQQEYTARQHFNYSQAQPVKPKEGRFSRNILSWLSRPVLQRASNPRRTNSSRYTIASITSQSSYADTSSTDCTSLNTLSSTAPPSSFASSRTSATTGLETESVFVHLNSRHIYIWNREQNVYMGKLLGCPPPVRMSTEWENVIRVRLLGDLYAVLQSLPHSLPRDRTVVEAELCMMGKCANPLEELEMIPTILIRCGGKRCKKAVENAVDDLDYLKNFSHGRVVVHRQAPRFASTTTNSQDLSPRPLSPSEDSTSVEVAVSENASACGLPIRTKHLGLGRFCTLGGLIQVNGKVYGLTTAHALVSLPNQPSSMTASDYDSGSDSNFSGSMTLPSRKTSRELKRMETECGLGCQTENWMDAKLGPYSYLTKRQPPGTNNAYPVSDASDFALIEIVEELSAMPNSYRTSDHGRCNSRTSDHESHNLQTITKLGSPLSEKSAKQVSIIRTFSDVRRGHLLSGDHVILDKGAIFSTKKIELDCALGSSGAWVVQGSSLLGIIIAVYDNEPYAHMLDITNVFQDIRALLSDGEQIPSVLVGGRAPLGNPSQRNTNSLAVDLAKRCLTRFSKKKPAYAPLPVHINSFDDENHTLPRAGLTPQRYSFKFGADLAKRCLARFSRTEPLLLPRHHQQQAFTTDPEKLNSRTEQVGRTDRFLLVVLVLASSCVYLDSVTITFLLPNITDSLNSLRHISFYLGFYRITAGVARPYAEAFSQKSPQKVLFLSLLILQVGWVLCGLSAQSWLFVAGRSLLGAGSAGVISSSKVLEPLLTAKEVHADGVFYSKVLTMAEWVSCLVGPFIGSAFADHLTWRWCMCFNAAIGILATVILIFTLQSISLTSLQARAVLRSCRSPLTPNFESSFIMTALSLSFIVGLGHVSSYGWHSVVVIVPVTISALSLLIILFRCLGEYLYIGDHVSEVLFVFCTILARAAPAIVVLYLPFWFQTIRSMSVSLSAVTMLATNIPIIGCAIIIRYRPLKWTQTTLFVLAISLVAVSAGLMALLTPSSNLWKWAATQILFGLGAGLVFSHRALLNTFDIRHTIRFAVDRDEFKMEPWARRMSYYFYVFHEPVVSMNIAVAHFLFMHIFGMELRRSSMEDVKSILNSGASNWMSAAALSSTTSSPSTVASQGILHRNILSQALKSTFAYAALISSIPSILLWIFALLQFYYITYKLSF